MKTGDLVKLSPTVARRSRQDMAEEGVGTGLAGTRMRSDQEAIFQLVPIDHCPS